MLTKGTMPMLATYMINFELVHATALIRLEFPIWLIAADLRGFGLTMNQKHKNLEMLALIKKKNTWDKLTNTTCQVYNTTKCNKFSSN